MQRSAKIEPSSPWAPFEDRRRAREEKRDAILNMAVRMFLADGYHRTPLNELARRLHITKPALYNYFGSKEEIIIECYRQGCRLFDASLAENNLSELSGLERLRAIIRSYVRLMTCEFGMCVVRVDDHDLSESAKAAVRKSKRKYDEAVRSCLVAGIADGSISLRDTRLAGMIITGAINSVGHWYRSDGGQSADKIADEFAVRLTEGMASPASCFSSSNCQAP